MTCRLGYVQSGKTSPPRRHGHHGERRQRGDYEVLYQLGRRLFNPPQRSDESSGRRGYHVGCRCSATARGHPRRLPAPAAQSPAAGGGAGGGGAVYVLLLLLLLGSVTWRLSLILIAIAAPRAFAPALIQQSAVTRPPAFTNSICAFATFRKNGSSASANSGALPWPVACDISWPSRA